MCAILCVTIKTLPEKNLGKLLQQFNLHPDFRVSFKEWIVRIDAQVAIGEAAYARTSKESVYDAMPGFWKVIQVKERHRWFSA